MRISSVPLLLFLLSSALGQSPVTASSKSSQNTSIPDLQAAALAAKAQQALTGGETVSDAALIATATWTAGSTEASGSATLRAKGTGEARLDVSAGEMVRTEMRNDTALPDGEWIGQNGVAHKLASHNCWTPASWFSPASFISAFSGSNAILSYVAAETRSGAAVDHVRFAQQVANVGDANSAALFTRFSQTEVYLDASSHLPLVLAWKGHPDDDYGSDIPVEIRFSDYRQVNGVQVPFHIQRWINGTLNLDLTVTSAIFNSGIPDSVFVLQGGAQ